jgi:hypothetical protein
MTRGKAIEVLKDLWRYEHSDFSEKDIREALDVAIKAVEQEPKTGRWVKISPADIYECSECGQNVMTAHICVYKYCHGCGAKMEGGQNGN